MDYGSVTERIGKLFKDGAPGASGFFTDGAMARKKLKKIWGGREIGLPDSM
jgi:hypothetical protein